MKKILLLVMLVASLGLSAQTARRFVVKLSDDGKAQMEAFLPSKPSGRAVVGCPGGGYSHLSMQNEGTDWAPFFNSRGIAYFVLTYRMPGGDRSLPISDAQNAMLTVRDSAEAWGVNPNDVGIMGFSAGGHLASTTATHAPIAARPNFQILFYPVISMNERETHVGSVRNFLGEGRRDEKLVREFSNHRQVTIQRTPQAIIILAGDDRAVPPLTNALPYYTALRRAGIPAALHIYPSGGHGFGFKASFPWHKQMTEELGAWLDALDAPSADAKRVACIGNSITEGYGLDMKRLNAYPAQLQKLLGKGYVVGNFGHSARTLLRAGDRPYTNEQTWRDAKAFAPDIAVVMLGANDTKPLNWDKHSGEFAPDLQKLVDELKALPTKPTIFLCRHIQSNSTSLQGKPNAVRDSVIVAGVIPAFEKVAKDNKLRLIDLRAAVVGEGTMQRDGEHPTAKGAALMAEAVAEAIKALEK